MAAFALLAILLASSLLQAQNSSNWTLTFADEFNGADLDLSRWSPRDPLRRPDYPAHLTDALRLEGGQLRISSRGAISTAGTFAQTYGRFEIRCKVPAVRGLRPVFKLLPVPIGPLPEIDVFELTGGAPSNLSFANRWGSEQTERSFGDSIGGPDLSTGFYTIAVEWDPDGIVWYIDGKEKFRSIDGIPHVPMYLFLTMTVDRGAEAASEIPDSFDIDYIHIYRRLKQRR